MRRGLLSFLAALLIALPPVGAAAQPAVESILRQLRAQGYSQITVSDTWLGRVRFLAIGNGLRREIILNPATGEILRDYWTPLSAGGGEGGQILAPGAGARDGGAFGGGADGDDDGDDGDDDGGDDGGGDDGEGGGDGEGGDD